MTYREIAWNFAQGGQLELAMAAWTMENLRQAGLCLTQLPKDGFSSQDDTLLRYLVDLLLTDKKVSSRTK